MKLEYVYFIDPDTGKFMPKHWRWNLWACIKYARKLKKRNMNTRIEMRLTGFHVFAGSYRANCHTIITCGNNKYGRKK